MLTRAIATVIPLLLTLLVAACGGSAAATPASDAGGPVVIRDAWVRAAGAGNTTAAYMTITNGRVAEDMLVGVSAPEVTQSASLHETTTDGSGMTGMQHTASIALPSGQAVELKPGGYHIMLVDLAQDLAVGDRVQLTLAFEQAGTIDVTAEVRAN